MPCFNLSCIFSRRTRARYVQHSQIWLQFINLEFKIEKIQIVHETKKQTDPFCLGLSKYCVHQVGWRLDEMCAKRSKKCAYLNSKMVEKCMATNGHRVDQLNQFDSRNTVCKCCTLFMYIIVNFGCLAVIRLNGKYVCNVCVCNNYSHGGPIDIML